MRYRVQLQNFEGPLDLLLFLIKKNEVNIYDIPIAKITQQYLEYLEIIELLDLENAGDFVLMAATLIRIKVQMLLPRPVLEEEEVEDPREALVKRLLEYQEYKKLAISLADLEKKQRDFFPRKNFEFELENALKGHEDNVKHEVTLFDLMAVFTEVLKKIPPKTHYTVERIPITIEEQSKFIMDYLDVHKEVLFTDLLAQINERIILIVTFVALLELVKRKRVQLNQNKPFAEIWIHKN